MRVRTRESLWENLGLQPAGIDLTFLNSWFYKSCHRKREFTVIVCVRVLTSGQTYCEVSVCLDEQV